MDPNHWGNLNQQYAARIGAVGLTGTPGTVPLLESHGLTGLGALSVPTALTPGTNIPGIAPRPYSHAIPGTMSQILDSLTATQSQYKTVPVGQPAYNLLESPSRSQAAVYAANVPKVSLFNTDPHTMRESTHGQSSNNTPSPGVESEPRTWHTANFPSQMVSLLSQPQDRLGQSERSTLQAPPPAHSGHARPTSVQKVRYSEKPQFPGNEPDRPRQAHSNNFEPERIRSQMLEEMLKPAPISQQPPQAHSNSHQSSVPGHQFVNQRPSSAQQQVNQRHVFNEPRGVPSLSSPQFENTSRTSVSQSSYQQSAPVNNPINSYQENSLSRPQPQTQFAQSSMTIGRAPQTPIVKVLTTSEPQPQAQSSYNSLNQSASGFNNTTLHANQYDPITPPPANRNDTPTISLQTFADISSNQQKIPMSTSCSTPPQMMQGSMLQQNPASNGGMLNSISTPQNITSPAASTHNSSCALAQDTLPLQSLAVQAQADSTTKPKRANRKTPSKQRSNSGSSRKKKGDSMSEESPVHGMTSPMATGGGVAPPAIFPHLPEPYPALHSSYSTISAEHIGLSHMASMSALPQQITAHEQVPPPVFMTNTFGNAFSVPGSSCRVKGEEFTVHGDHQNPLVDSEHDVMLSQISPNHPRTKAEQKEMPRMSVVNEDDEFCHLDTNNKQQETIQRNPNQCLISKNSPNYMTANPHGRPHNNPQCKPPGNPQGETQPTENPQAETAKPKSKDSSFQSSFLSFLQGNKQETLSSVTNSAITNKPQLPKYVPEPPRPKPRPQPPKAVNKPQTTPIAKDTAGKSLLKRPLVVTFSDDEDDDSMQAKKEVSNTVEKVLSNLGEETPMKKSSATPSAKATTKGGNSASTSGAPVYKILSTTPAATPKSKKASRGRPRKPSSLDDEPPTLKPKVPEIPLDELPPREKSSRKAKEKLEAKRKAKKKRKKKEYSDESDSEDEDEAFSLASDSEPDEKNYDSDKDPVWTPFAQDLNRVDYEDEDRSRRGKQRKRARSPVNRTLKRGRASSAGGNASHHASADGAAPKPSAISDQLLDFLSDDEEPIHTFQKGSFVIDRRDLEHYEDFPIWKVDAGKLLQKFEKVTEDGKTYYKSLSTYSSWTDNIRERYKAILTRWVSRDAGRDQDLVEIDPDSMPRPIDERLEEEPMMQAFNVFVQILVSQALEPGFLAAIQNEEDEYYATPMKKINDTLAEKKERIATRVKWMTNLRESTEKYPFLSMGYRDNAAVSTSDRPLLRGIQLSGKAYNRATLEEVACEDDVSNRAGREFLIGHAIAECVQLYHSLHHYQYIMYKRCLSKVALLRGKETKEQSDILDQCLQNRSWVHKLFKNFQKLLDKAASMISESTPSPEATPTNQTPAENVASS